MKVMKLKRVARKGVLKKKRLTPRKADVTGLRRALAKTTMTKEAWGRIRRSQDGKWPVPDYMKKGGLESNHYQDQTYEIVSRFHDKTRIKYRPYAKAPGSKSHVRYNEYMKSRTIGEALKKGSWPLDWCHDFEHGFLQIQGEGQLRDLPIDITQVQGNQKLTDVDRAVVQWYKKELCKKYNLNMKELSDTRYHDTTIMRAHRLVAQREARRILTRVKKTKGRVTDADVLSVLREWGFARNPNRLNVMRKGQNWVWSDTLGLLRDRCGDIHLTQSTHGYPEVVHVINLWLKDHLPKEAAPFTWTSLNVNKDYAARIHRDGNNLGPSMIAAFGDFKGGALNYYADDEGKGEPEKLEKAHVVPSKFDLGKGLALFNGNCAHSVDDFEGNRFSIVFFTISHHMKMKDADRKKLEDMGAHTPKHNADPYQLLRPPRGDKGKVVKTAAANKKNPASRYWKRKP